MKIVTRTKSFTTEDTEDTENWNISDSVSSASSVVKLLFH
jgi:hypothetical protein